MNGRRRSSNTRMKDLHQKTLTVCESEVYCNRKKYTSESNQPRDHSNNKQLSLDKSSKVCGCSNSSYNNASRIITNMADDISPSYTTETLQDVTTSSTLHTSDVIHKCGNFKHLSEQVEIEKQDLADEWKLISQVLDRLFFIIFLVCSILITVLFLLQCKMKENEQFENYITQN